MPRYTGSLLNYVAEKLQRGILRYTRLRHSCSRDSHCEPLVHVILDAERKDRNGFYKTRRVLHLPRLRVSRVERARDDAAFTCIMQKRMETRTSPMLHSIYDPRHGG